MRFITMGSEECPTLLFIHGLSATAGSCYGIVGRLLSDRWHIVLCELDGHHHPPPARFGICPERDVREAGISNCNRIKNEGNAAAMPLISSILANVSCIIQAFVSQFIQIDLPADSSFYPNSSVVSDHLLVRHLVYSF